MIPKAQNRFITLDALRGIAALGVALSHFTYLYDKYFGHTFKYVNLSALGGLGVKLFFILSGFVIFFSINHTNSAVHFLKKRGIRLYPTY